jgi:hypothetical protein
VVVWLAFTESRAARSPAWALLRCLWPSWRFFDGVAPAPELAIRVMEGEGEFGRWRPALSPPKRRVYSVFLNAEGNLHLAKQSLIERLLQELDGELLEEAPSLLSYILVRRLVEAELASFACASGCYQFKLSDPETPEPLFVSAPHQLGEL